MSEEKEGKGKTIEHKIEVSTSAREEKLSKEKDTMLTEKAKLEKELEDLKTKYDNDFGSLKTEYESLKGDFENINKSNDEYKQKFTELALKRFDGEKTAILDRAKDAGLAEEKIKEMNEKIKLPEDLERWKYTLTTLVEQLEAGKNASKEAKSKESANPDKKGSGGEGNATLTEGNVDVSADLKKKVFNSPKEMVDYLYQRIARGKVITRQVSDGKGNFKTVEERVGEDIEARDVLNELWNKYFQSEKTRMEKTRTFVMCPKCKGMYDAGKGTCPICGVPLTTGPNSEQIAGGTIKRLK